MVQLNDDQRKELEQLAAQNGMPLPEGALIDKAGNANVQHGFAGQPAWAKALEIGGAALAGGLLAAPLLGGVTGAAPEVGIAGLAPSTLAGIGGATAGAGKGILGAIGSTLGKAAPILSGAGKAIGAATSAAGQNQMNQEAVDRAANAQNISGQQAFQNELQNMATTEAGQRTGARKDLYRASAAKNPRVSPFDPVGGPKLSPEYMAGLSDLEKEALLRLSQPAQYGTNTMQAPSYTPYVPKKIGSTMQTIGNWASPALSIAGAISPYLS